MRLEDMSFTDYLTAEYDLRERQRKERMKQAEFEKYAKENNLFVCSTDMIEQIRAEIEQIKPYELPWDKRTPEHIRDMALEIVEKYADQEQTDENLHREREQAYMQGYEDASKKYRQEPKTGHWIEEDMFDGDVAYRCSECNELFWIESGTPKDNEYYYCPKCGKRLVEPQESEESE